METTITIADTGFIVALINRSDVRHPEVASVYAQRQDILLPQTVLAEVAYLLGRDAGAAVVVAFLRGVSSSKFCLAPLVELDISRVAQILEEYADSRIDFVDASVMAVAERYCITKILTRADEG